MAHPGKAVVPTLGGGNRSTRAQRSAAIFTWSAASIAGLLGAMSGCGGGTPANAGAENALAADTAASGRRQLVTSAATIAHGGVEWKPALIQSFGGMVEAPGQLAPNEDRTARLGAPAQGRVLAMHVQVGDRVSAGQPLVTLQSAEASTARADYNKSLADLGAKRAGSTYARTARERAERLLSAKAIARQELERAQADDELARGELNRAEAEVIRAKATLQQLGVGSDGAMVLRSSLTGVVLSREATPGMVVQPGMPLVAVSDPRTLWLLVSVPDRGTAAVRIGSRVRFSVPTFPRDTFDARVASIGNALTPETRTLPVRAVVENNRGVLRPHMFATVWIEITGGAGGLAVPETAVVLLDQKPVVFVVRPGAGGAARFERRDVEVAPSRGGMVQIVSGVNPGELVVTGGAFAVKSEFSRTAMQPGG